MPPRNRCTNGEQAGRTVFSRSDSTVGYPQPSALAHGIVLVRGPSALVWRWRSAPRAPQSNGTTSVRLHLDNRCPFLITYSSGAPAGFPTLKGVNNLGAVLAHVRVVSSRAVTLNYRVVHDHDLSELGYVSAALPFQIKPANPQIFLPQIFYPLSRPGDVCPECCPRRRHGLRGAQDTSPVIFVVRLSAFGVRGDMPLQCYNGERSSET